jgi:hypothetical protein
LSLSDWIALGAVVVALAALVVSIAAFRQRARYHPQPKLVLVWEDKLRPIGNGLFGRAATIHNHGDAGARDLQLDVSTGIPNTGGAWHRETVLEPGSEAHIIAPVINDVTTGYGSMGRVYNRQADPATYAFVTPTVTARWRQAPFGGKPREKRWRAPRTPNLKEGETS